MAEPMKIRTTLKGDLADVRVLMVHPMETGQRKDTDGKIVPVHFIQEVSVRVNGKVALEGQISQAVSRNPVFSFRLKGAYAQLPRYFKDADRVMDLETRLLHCMTTLQGRSRAEATKRIFGNEDQPSEMEYLSAYIAGQSRGASMAPGSSHPKETAAYALGRKLFFYRAGPWDFSCASCHGEEGKRIRMQDLPVLSTPAAARPVVATWPAYRVSNSQFKTMQWRINDCYRQMRMPEPNYTSDLTIAIATYLTVTGKGEPYRGPGTKR